MIGNNTSSHPADTDLHLSELGRRARWSLACGVLSCFCMALIVGEGTIRHFGVFLIPRDISPLGVIILIVVGIAWWLGAFLGSFGAIGIGLAGVSRANTYNRILAFVGIAMGAISLGVWTFYAHLLVGVSDGWWVFIPGLVVIILAWRLAIPKG